MFPLYIQEIKIDNLIPDDNYVKDLSVVKNIKKLGGLSFKKPVTFLVGENGIGKSTLIEAIAVGCGFNPEGGTKNFNFNTKNTHSDLYKYLKIVRGYMRPKDGFFLRAESFYNVSTNIDALDEAFGFGAKIIDSYGGVSLHNQSHGESFLSLVKNRFGGNGIYILDEPEAALSPTGLMKLMIYINDLVKKNSQFIISTHSPLLMTFPNAEIYEITSDNIESIPFDKTSHYSITRSFLENPKKMLDILLNK